MNESDDSFMRKNHKSENFVGKKRILWKFFSKIKKEEARTKGKEIGCEFSNLLKEEERGSLKKQPCFLNSSGTCVQIWGESYSKSFGTTRRLRGVVWSSLNPTWPLAHRWSCNGPTLDFIQ